jgi:hypothetical protein
VTQFSNSFTATEVYCHSYPLLTPRRHELAAQAKEGDLAGEEAMGPPQPARGGPINIEACARPIAVDNRISLPYYFRIAGSLLRQANIYRNEKNILDLYVILLRYSRWAEHSII